MDAGLGSVWSQEVVLVLVFCRVCFHRLVDVQASQEEGCGY